MRKAKAAAVCAAAVALIASPAGAHSLLRASTPGAGAQVASAPEVLTLTFTEPPEPTLTSVRVLSAAGDPVTRGPAEPAPGDPKVVRVPLSSLARGVYTVTWRVVSRVDGHATAGSFAFGVGVAPAPGASSGARGLAPEPSPLEMAGRFTLFAGMALLLGAGLLALAGAPPGGALARAAATGCLAAAVGVIVLAEAQRRAAGTGLGDLAATPIGRALLLRAVAVAGVGGCVLVAALRPKAARGWLIGAGAITAAAAAVHVGAGHAGARGAVSVAAQAVHVVAGGIWIGGLAALLVVARGAASPEKARLARRFSTAAGIAVVVVAATAVVRALDEVGRWSALTGSGYGRAVLAKSSLLVALVGLGAINRYRQLPLAETRLEGLRRVARAEVTLGALALALAAVMASISPPAVTLAAQQQGTVLSGSDFATSVRVRLVVTPGGAGVNRFTASVTDYDSRAPVDAERVALRFSYLGLGAGARSELRLERTGSGRYTGEGANLSLEGRWLVTVQVQRGAGAVEVPLVFATPCETTVVRVPNEPPIHTAAAGGGTVQMYLDPGGPGRNEVHATFFGPTGAERPVTRVRLEAGTGAQQARALEPRKLSAGHLVADATLTPGRWRFDVVAPLPGGSVRACFEEEIG